MAAGWFGTEYVLVPTVTHASGIVQQAYNLIQDEGSNLTRRTTLNFTGSGVSCLDGSGKTTCDIPGGGASAYDTIQDEGSALTQRSVLNFTGAGVTCVDDAGNSRTNCDIPGGGGGGGVFSTTNLTPPPTGGTITNSNGATLTYNADNSAFTFGGPGTAGSNIRFVEFTIPMDGNFTFTTGFTFQSSTQLGRVGMTLHESATDKIALIGFDTNGLSAGVIGSFWTGLTSCCGSNYLSLGPGALSTQWFFRFTGDNATGSTITVQWSTYPTGPWFSIGSFTNNSTTKYDKYGVGIDAFGASTLSAVMTVMHMTYTNP